MGSEFVLCDPQTQQEIILAVCVTPSITDLGITHKSLSHRSGQEIQSSLE